jgi:hypothetical protein
VRTGFSASKAGPSKLTPSKNSFFCANFERPISSVVARPPKLIRLFLSFLRRSHSKTMKIQGHLQDYPLPVLLEVLADRHESGCLRIAFEPEPAILYFSRGQLVDARMSLLQGSAAINLALSMEKAPFDFDNEIAPPESVIDNHDRAILSRLIGVRLRAEETEPAPVHSTIQFKPNSPDVRFVESSIIPNSDPAAVIKRQSPANLEQSPRAEFTGQSKYLDNAGKVFSYLPRQKLLRTVAVILVVAVPAAVGLTVRFGKRMVTSPENAVYEKPTTAPESSPASVSSRTISGSSPAAAGLTEEATHQTPFPVKNKPDTPSPATEAESPKIIAESESSKVISEITKVTEGAGLDPDSSSGPETRLVPTKKTIVVEVQFEQGRVTGAWIKNPRKGLEAFEAAAIRVIRQRRYAKGSIGTESVSVDVTVN